MKKVTYELSGLFSLRQVDDSHLNARSYRYATKSAIRGAILSAVIQLDGVKKAKELFESIKQAEIYVQFPKEVSANLVKLRMASNQYYGKDQPDETTITVGVREFLHMDNIVFYIDNSIPNINLYLNNIDRIGDSNSIVFLSSIEEDVKKMENILVEWIEERDGDQEVFEMTDWDKKKMNFENIYLYSNKRRRDVYHRFLCFVKDKYSL